MKELLISKMFTKGFYMIFGIFVLLSMWIEVFYVKLNIRLDGLYVFFCVLSIVFMTLRYTKTSKSLIPQLTTVVFTATAFSMIIKILECSITSKNILIGTVVLSFIWYFVANSNEKHRQNLLMVLLLVSLSLFSPMELDFKIYYIAMVMITVVAGLNIVEINDKLINTLSDYERLHNILFNNSNEAFAIHEMIYENDQAIDYKFISINEAFTKLTGLTEEQVLNKNVLSVLPDLDPFWITTYGEVLKAQNSKVFTMYEPGMKKHFKIVAVPASKNQFATMFLDVSARVSSEQLLKEAHESLKVVSGLKTQFLKDINHRIRTPLNGLYGMLQLIKEDVKEDQQELIDSVLTETEHIRNITNQVSKYVDLQGLEYHQSMNNLNEAIHEVTEEFSKHSEYISVIHSECMNKTYSFDKAIFKSVLRELLTNAVRYAPEKAIRINCELIESESSQKIKVIVEDEGEGLNDEQFQYVFNEFYHHNSMEIYKDDNQLSLAMCKQLMVNCYGDLYFEDIKGIGARFVIVLVSEKS